MTNRWPKDQIDHINRNKSDDRWINLREASSIENMRNRRSWNKLGRGVSKRPNGKYRARITVDGKIKHLGDFARSEDAALAYVNAAERLHGAFFCDERS
jgi:hypothetical protein